MRILIIGFLTLLLILFPKTSSAQEKPGITVTPSIIRLDLSTDTPEAEIYYKNSTKVPIELKLSAQDFSQEEETGRVRFLLEQDAKNYQYSLTSWITFEKSSITLTPGEGQNIKIFINKDKLTAGGHYATILAEVRQSEKAGQLPIKAILSTLIFVRATTGSEREELRLQSAQPLRGLLEFPNKFVLRLQNSGNVEVIPFGLVEIRGIFGNTIARGIINEGSLITLPESIRRFDVPLIRLSNFLPPGIYTASVNIHFGKEDKSLKSSITFISQGSINLLLVGLILAALLTALSAHKSFQARQHQRR